MYIIIASPGEDDGRRRGKFEVGRGSGKWEVTKRGPPPPSSPSSRIIIATSASDERSRPILGYFNRTT